MATSKIVKFDPKPPFQGVTSAFVTFEDEKWGFFEYGGDAQFKEGDEVEYTATEEKTKGGKKIFKLTMKKVSQTDTPLPDKPPKVEFGKDKLVEFKMQLRRDVIRTIGVAASAGRIEPKEMAEYYNEFYMATDASVDELCK